MSREDLIYQLSKIVYHRLANSAGRETIESLVSDLYRFFDARAGADRPAAASEAGGRPAGSAERLVISVFGLNRPGIVAAITRVLAEAGHSIVDINQTVVQDKFAMVMVVDSSGSEVDVNTLRQRLSDAGDELGVRVYAQREDLFNAMHRV